MALLILSNNSGDAVDPPEPQEAADAEPADEGPEPADAGGSPVVGELPAFLSQWERSRDIERERARQQLQNCREVGQRPGVEKVEKPVR